jgi:tetratricopeptide (TPR) repeat protein
LHEGELLFNQRKLDEARVQYERAAALDPRYSTAWIYAGDCFYFQKNYAEAENRFRKGVEVEPLNSQGWRFLADALVAQEKIGPAEGALMSGIAAQPSQLPNWVKLNQLRTGSGFPLAPLNLVRKAKGELDTNTKTLNLSIDPSLKSLDPHTQPDAVPAGAGDPAGDRRQGRTRKGAPAPHRLPPRRLCVAHGAGGVREVRQRAARSVTRRSRPCRCWPGPISWKQRCAVAVQGIVAHRV